MKKLFLFAFIFVAITRMNAQNTALFPNATWLQDVHWAGTVYAGIGAPVMVDVQAHAGAYGELTFYLKGDEVKAEPLIEAIHAQGRKYWVNIDASRLEGVTAQEIVNDGQGISDTLFGSHVSLEGHVSSDKKSINRPAWRNYFIACIKRAIDAGADGSQHDAGWPPYDSFDDDALNAFKEYVIDNGINTYDWDYNSMTFREYLLSKGKTDATVFDNDGDPTEVKNLIDAWKTFKAIRTLNSWKIIKDSCQTYAQSLGKNYTIAINAASKFATRDGHAYWASDYFIGEFFDWGNYYPLTGSVTARAKMAEAFGKRFICWSSPTLEDLDDGDPTTGYGSDIESEAEKILAAQLYASGGLPQLKYPATRTYPVFFLAQNNSDLLNSVSPYGEIGVLMSQAQMIKDTRGLEGLIVVLQDINRSLQVVWLKSNLLNLLDDFTLNDIQKYKALFLPEVFYLTDNQKNVLLQYMNDGGTIVAVRGNVEYCGQYDENGNENTVAAWTDIADQTNSGVFAYGNGKYINIAHNILESNGYPPPSYGAAYLNDKADPTVNDLAVAIRDTVQKWVDFALPIREVFTEQSSPYLRFFRYQDSSAHRYVYQVLSDSVYLASRQPVELPSFEVQLAVSPNSYHRLFKATWYSIDQPEGIEIANNVAVNAQTGRITVTIPAFKRWGFVHLDGSEYAAQNIQIGKLTINGSSTFKRLKSRSSVTGSWEVLSGTPDYFEVEIWTNIRNMGDPVVSDQVLSKMADGSNEDNDTFSRKYLNGATRLFVARVAAATTDFTVSADALHDSLVYLYRVRAVQNTDTSAWIHQFFYRNAPPGAPHHSQIFTASQNLWYLTDNGFSPADTSRHPVIAFNKAEHYGGDYELDSLLFGVYVYTDRVTGQKGDTTSTLYLIGEQFKHKLAYNQSMPDARGDIQDTISFSLDSYENFGIYFRAVATDGIDTSAFSPWFWFYLDNHNDPPNPFHLIEPANYSSLEREVPFKWENNGDPDPLDKEGMTISKVEILFDSIPTFDSPGLRSYTRERSGNAFERDTITIDLPSDFFHAEGLDSYDVVYWKARMYDFDWHSPDGSKPLYRESTETFSFSVGASSVNLQTPILKQPLNHSKNLTLNVSLKWDPVPNAQTYRLQVALDANFQNVIRDIGNLTFTNFDLFNIEPGKTYFWRIMATNANGHSNWSSAWDFDTMKLPGPVVLIAPLQSSTVLGDTVQFLWHRAFPLAEKYWIEISDDNVFSRPQIDSTIVDTVYNVAGLTPDKVYYWRVKAVNAVGWGAFSKVQNFKVGLTVIPKETVPRNFNLFQNYPNPFNPVTTISFSLPKWSFVKIDLFNAKGQKLKTLLTGKHQAGVHQLKIDMSQWPSGIYFYKMMAEKYRCTKKMILLK